MARAELSIGTLPSATATAPASSTGAFAQSAAGEKGFASILQAMQHASLSQAAEHPSLSQAAERTIVASATAQQTGEPVSAARVAQASARTLVNNDAVSTITTSGAQTSGKTLDEPAAGVLTSAVPPNLLPVSSAAPTVNPVAKTPPQVSRPVSATDVPDAAVEVEAKQVRVPGSDAADAWAEQSTPVKEAYTSPARPLQGAGHAREKNHPGQEGPTASATTGVAPFACDATALAANAVPLSAPGNVAPPIVSNLNEQVAAPSANTLGPAIGRTPARPVLSAAAKTSAQSVSTPPVPANASLPAKSEDATTTEPALRAANHAEHGQSKEDASYGSARGETHAAEFSGVFTNAHAAVTPHAVGASFSLAFGNTATHDVPSVATGTNPVTRAGASAELPSLPATSSAPLKKLEVSVQDPVLGAVGVQAEMRGGVLHASVSGSQEAVGASMSSLHHYLQDQQIAVSTLSFSAPAERVNGPASATGAGGFTHTSEGSPSRDRQDRRDSQDGTRLTDAATSGTAVVTGSAWHVQVTHEPAAYIPAGSTLSIHI